jgi:hypothetical protein
MTEINSKAGFSVPSNQSCEVNPVEKPTELYNAIRQMRYLSERLDALYERMGSCSPINDAPDTDGDRDVCLLEVLNEGSQLVRGHLDYQHQRIIDIEQLIFNR